ncbi:MscL family protein [Mycoplasma sp. NEAQ87857]|nr:MscL family protein [Mycoplasma sp. NEAQ87857]
MFKKSLKDAKGSLKKGNFLMLAIGLLLGTVFGAVVKSISDDIIMAPIIAHLKLDDIKQLKWGDVRIGNFLAAVISLVIVNLVIFLVLVTYFVISNKRKEIKERKNPTVPSPVVPTTDQLILEELQKLNNNFNQNKE